MVPACRSGTLTDHSAATLECHFKGTYHDTPASHSTYMYRPMADLSLFSIHVDVRQNTRNPFSCFGFDLALTFTHGQHLYNNAIIVVCSEKVKKYPQSGFKSSMQTTIACICISYIIYSIPKKISLQELLTIVCHFENGG